MIKFYLSLFFTAVAIGIGVTAGLPGWVWVLVGVSLVANAITLILKLTKVFE